jgi:hypothetical protein
MYRVFEPVDGAWQLLKEYKKLPKDFTLPEGYQLERTNANGSVTIVESPDLTTDDIDASKNDNGMGE